MNTLRQEIEVWYIIPAIRKYFVKELKKSHIRQRAIARRLGLTDACVSQYGTNKRSKFTMDEVLSRIIKKPVEELTADQNKTNTSIQNILDDLRKFGKICDVCTEHGVKEGCKICYGGK